MAEDGGKAFMVRRATESSLGFWSFPVDYVDRGKVVEEAAARETGTIVSITGLLGLFSQQGSHAGWSAFKAIWVYGIVISGTQTSEAVLFSAEDPPLLAFACDVKILVAWQRSRNNQDKSEWPLYIPESLFSTNSYPCHFF